MPETLEQTLLLKEFDQRFEEKLIYIQRYQRQTDLIQLYLGVIVGLGAVTFSPGTKQFLQTQTILPGVHAEAAVFVFAVFAGLVAEHFLFSIVDAWIMIFRNARRMAKLEARLNELCGCEVMSWDSRIAPAFHSFPTLRELPLRTDILSTITILLIVLAVATVLLVITWLLAKSYFTAFAIVVLFFAGLNVYQSFRISTAFVRELGVNSASLRDSDR
jgi:hypothetical protein